MGQMQNAYYRECKDVQMILAFWAHKKEVLICC
jgi:hypothetical protein